MEPCTKAKEIESIQKDLHKLEEAIEGNGKPGMKAELIMIKDEQRNMNGLLSTLNTSLGGVMKFMVETQKAEAIAEKLKAHNANTVSIVVTAIIGVAAIIVAIIFKT